MQFLTSVSTESSVSGGSSVISESSESSLWGGATCILMLFLCCEHHHVQKSYLRKIKTFFFNLRRPTTASALRKVAMEISRSQVNLVCSQILDELTGQPVKFILGCAPKEKLFKNV